MNKCFYYVSYSPKQWSCLTLSIQHLLLGNISNQIQIVSLLVFGETAGPLAETIVELIAKQPLSQGGGSSSESGATATSSYRHGLTVIDAAQLKWDAPPTVAAGRVRVPHRCRVQGHFIQHCATNGDPRFDIRRAAPAPASSSAPPASVESDGVIPAELYCKICRNVMADAVVTSKCCFDSFCDGCIRDHIAAKSNCVCGAQSRADDLIPNKTLRTTIANLLATTTGAAASASSVTERTRSSAGSNVAEPAPHPQIPATTQASCSSVSSEKAEHSDGGASTLKKSPTISGVLRPRKARETVGDHSAESGARAVDGCHHGNYGFPFCPAAG